MIPVQKQPEPHDFDREVRQRGRKWLADHCLPTTGDLPSGTELPAYWRHCLADLHRLYDGICAYVCMYIPPITGSGSADHYIPKSRAAQHAYEWDNYRLACSKMNSRKHSFEDVLDPFHIAAYTFVLNLFSGQIDPNPALPVDEHRQALDTIERLGLDDAECRKLRLDWLDEYRRRDISLNHLKAKSPFVYQELIRQEGPSPAQYSM